MVAFAMIVDYDLRERTTEVGQRRAPPLRRSCQRVLTTRVRVILQAQGPRSKSVTPLSRHIPCSRQHVELQPYRR
jgi:hypothetical protein